MFTSQHLSKDWEETFDAIDDWITIINLDSTVLRSNRSIEKYFKVKVQDSIRSNCCQIIHGTEDRIEGCPLPTMIETKQRQSAEVKIDDGRWVLVTVDPIFNGRMEITKAVHIVRDITGNIKIQEEKEQLLENLKTALDRIKVFTGLIPICSGCKEIRDERGHWYPLEVFIEKHSDVSFTHSLCPICYEEFYSKEDWYKKRH